MSNEYDVCCNLKEILDEKGMSIRELTERSGLKFETVRRLYHDKTVQYHRRSIAAICHTLNIDVSELLSLREIDK